MLWSMKRALVYSSSQPLNMLVPLCFCPALQVTPCWNTTGWSSPPKTGTTTTPRTTVPPSITAPGGTATATRPTSTASTCAGSTPPTRTASSGPPGPAGSTRSSFLRWRFGLPAIWKTNELLFCSCSPASSSHLVCWPKHTTLTFTARPHMILFLLYYPVTCSVLASIIHLWPLLHWKSYRHHH